MSSAKITFYGEVFGYISWDDKRNTSVFEMESNFNLESFNPAPLIINSGSGKIAGFDFDDIYNGLFPSFIDSLPDSFGNKVFKAWMVEKGLEEKDFNPVERLLYVGTRGVGTFEFEKGKEIERGRGININELAALANEIAKGKGDLSKDEIKSLEGIVEFGGTSIGGAQAKILLGIQNGKFVPGDVEYDIPTDYYVLKLTTNEGDLWSPNKNKIEFVYNELARNAGVIIADSQLIELDGLHHFASKRFDRVNSEKLHTQTFFSLTGQFTSGERFDYNILFKLLDHFKSNAETKRSLFKQMVFNILSGNTDTHYKNFAFIMDKEGKWDLSPAYDITFPRNPFETLAGLHFAEVNGKRDKITRADFLVVAKEFGILRPVQLIEQVEESLKCFWKEASKLDIPREVKSLINSVIETNIKFSNLKSD